MSAEAQVQQLPATDPVSNVLKWILLATGLICFAFIFWATAITYERAPPQPERFVGPDGATVMTAIDVVAGTAGSRYALIAAAKNSNESPRSR